MFNLNHDIGVDLGTANTLVFARGRGIVIREPSVVALDQETGKVLAVGHEARRMLGRTPGNIVALRPLRDGVIAHYDATEVMLRHFLGRVLGRYSVIRPRVMVCVPSGITSVEQRAVLEAAQVAGARRTYLIEEPLAAALGAGLDISEARGSMVVDIGGGTVDIAVLSLGGIVVSASLKAGGDRFDEAIIRYMKKEHNLAVGERSAEEIKVAIGTVDPESPVRRTEVRGRDLITGLPRTVNISSEEVCRAVEEVTTAIVDGVRAVLDRTPPELAADILERGIVLTGGGALLDGMDRILSRHTDVPVIVAEDPLSCVVLGAGKALETIDVLRPQLLSR